uniref:LON peptidase N-terminal domain and RING finger protein 3-like n=1 Tax=Petromyzon marinus TaxID=7757 RepID=A0AAJ7U6T1_PETMA|nr:LON peptidase N-terminal domain and RING finger protein 3-like [Petromyzon marinus]
MFKQVSTAMATPPSAEALDAEGSDAALRRGDALARQGRLDDALDAYAAARRLGVALSGERLFALARLMAARLRVNINNNNTNNHSGEASRRRNLAPSGKRGEADTAGAAGSAFAGSGSAGFAGSPGPASVGSGSGSASLVRPGGLGGAARSGLGSEMSAGSASVSGLFDCCLCRLWLSEPVTLSCGHSCCRSCAELRVPGAAFDEAASSQVASSQAASSQAASSQAASSQAASSQAASSQAASSQGAARELAVEACGTCGAVSARAPGTPVRVNVLLGGLLAKWFPRRAEAAQLRVEAARLFAVGAELRTTLGMCERALALDPGDVGALVIGSKVRLEMGDPTGALRDAEQACRAQPHNAQAVVARGWSLLALGRQEEAVGALLRGLALDATQESAARAIGEILSEWLSPVPEQVGVASRSLKCGTFLESLGNQPANHCTEGQVEVHKKRKHSVSDSDCDGEGQPPHPDSAECYYIREVPRHRIDPSDLECSLCMRLLWEPVTTPCGHTFCTACLERSLDHRHQCPLCKEGLVEFLARAVFTRNACLEGVMVHFLAEERRERERQNAEERKEMAGEVPIFVCTVAFPWVPCPLHVFEARYRLMLRRCIRDGTRSFGMCAWDQQHGFADVGCMLEVRGVHLYPDGRSLVSAVGGRRFQVTERSARDGYSTARVALLHDTPVRGDAVRELCRLHEVVRTCAERWFSKLEPRYHGCISQHFGDMPQTEPDIQTRPDGPAWLWWLIAVLPLEPRVQLGLLGLTSLPARLAAVAQLLAHTVRTHAPQPPQSLQPSLPQPQPRQQQQQPSHQQQLEQQPSQQQPEQLQQQALQQQPNQQQMQHQPSVQPLQMLEPLSQLQFSPRRHQQEHHDRQQPCPSQQQPPCQQQQGQHRSEPQGQQYPQKQQPHTEPHHQQQAQADVMGTPRLQGEPRIAMEEQPTASLWVAATQQTHVQPWGRPGKQPQGIQPNSPARSDSHPQQQAKPRVCMPPELSRQLTKRLHTQQHALDAAMCTTAHTTKLSSKTATRSNTLTTSRMAAHLTMQMTAQATPHMTSQSTVHAISDADPHATATACAFARSTSNAAARATAYATAHTTAHAKTYAAAYTKVQTAEAMAHTAESAQSTSHSDANSVGHTVMRAEGQAIACPATHVVGHKSRHVASLTDVSTRHTTKHTVTHRPTPTAENTQTMRHKATHTMAHVDTTAINNHQVDTTTTAIRH